MGRTSLRTVSRRRRARGGAVSAAAALAVVAGLLQFTSPVAVAAVAGDMPTVTLPGAQRTAPRVGFLTAADASGYLAAPGIPGAPLSPAAAWRGRDGSTKWIAERPNTIAYNGGLGLTRVPATPQTRNVYEIRRFATDKVTRFSLPVADRGTAVFAENRLLVARKVGGKWTLHLLETPAGGGKPVERPVTGLADDFSGSVTYATSDKRGAAFGYTTDDGKYTRRNLLLDFGTATATYVPSDDFYDLSSPHLAGDTVSYLGYSRQTADTRLYVIDRARPEVPGRLLDTPRGDLLATRVIGGWVLYPGGANNGIVAVPVTGGPARTLLPASYQQFVDGDDGSFFIEGGTDAKHWAVQRVTLGSDGVPVFKPVGAPLPPVSVYEAGGVAVDQGRVLLGTERKNGFYPYPGTDLTAFALSLTADGTLSAAPPQSLGSLGYTESNPSYDVHCYADCLRFTSNGEGGIPHPEQWVTGVVAASASYRVQRDGLGLSKRVFDGEKTLAVDSWPAAALWGSTLWTARTVSGRPTFETYALPSMRKLGSQVLASCLPTDLQVVGRYVYWSCGPDKAAVVYDQKTRSTQSVPRGYAKLADGYLVSQDNKAGKLLITYLKGAVPAARVGTKELGPLPSPPFAPVDRRGRFWNVDRFGGPVAYLTASGAVTVKWPQVTVSPLAATDASVPTSIDPREGGGDFEGVWHLNRPVATWKLTVTDSAGAVVRTLSGGRVHGKIAVTWDGRTANGALVRAGTYRVTLTARTANGTPRNAVVHDKPLTVR
ncbi:FlgD immunoglobulin-like domain containing protein [Streptomyces geranii]|uniref:FlgD immunoglobulin-like domain containing protein n=1 Tax=Streptomyces geranii TaxID=2058923 RepID=UPI00130084B9|nr:FlgD immunoglobulin-like domain containing protein [Streptomyces geranii]